MVNSNYEEISHKTMQRRIIMSIRILMDVTLPEPLYMESQIEDIVNDLSEGGLAIESDTILRIMNYTTAVVFNEFTGEAEELVSHNDTKWFGDDKKRYTAGAAAIRRLLERYNPESLVMPITEVHLTSEMLRVSNPFVWWDISCLFDNLTARIERTIQMFEMNFPPIIAYHERRLLWEALQNLDTNALYDGREGYTVNPVRREGGNGVPCRALRDIGYSLAYGWEDYMVERFRREQEEVDKIREEAMAEAMAMAGGKAANE